MHMGNTEVIVNDIALIIALLVDKMRRTFD